MINLAQQIVELAAGEVRQVAETGGVFSCAWATDSFDLSLDGGAFVAIQTGYTIDSRPNSFTSVVLRNPNTFAITVAFFVSSCKLSYPSNYNPVTYPKGSGIVTLAAIGGPGDWRVWSGLDGNNVRKQIIVNNLTANTALDLLDKDGHMFCHLSPGILFTVEMGGPITIINRNAVPVDLVVGEIFYA